MRNPKFFLLYVSAAMSAPAAIGFGLVILEFGQQIQYLWLASLLFGLGAFYILTVFIETVVVWGLVSDGMSFDEAIADMPDPLMVAAMFPMPPYRGRRQSALSRGLREEPYNKANFLRWLGIGIWLWYRAILRITRMSSFKPN